MPDLTGMLSRQTCLSIPFPYPGTEAVTLSIKCRRPSEFTDGITRGCPLVTYCPH